MMNHLCCECHSISAAIYEKASQKPQKRCQTRTVVSPGSIHISDPAEIEFLWKHEGVCDFRCKMCGAVFRIEQIKSQTDQTQPRTMNNSNIIEKVTLLSKIKCGHNNSLLLNQNLPTNRLRSSTLATNVPLPIRKYFSVMKHSRSSSYYNLKLSTAAESVEETCSPLSEWSNDTDFDMMFSLKRRELIGSFNPLSLAIESF
ncbi:hypothetical protein TRFO_14312 [Tritrichomonas foetus]|uniref:Uncharacterized protein n=1 Tax=Tritrichomonas foetus TaxID=1144522 RepID=A0A1J4KW85_9EUKA|nr:hypothetical protein TRFO_14312 [Tritrichomonas foetus]|eukprot:OHT15152.1 hypothetical protein TRFO_14312 [Tritrichomonas foetus]